MFKADFINNAWTSDLTLCLDWKRLALYDGHYDLYNRQIIGHSFSKRITAETTENPALDMALMHRKPVCGVLLHSDQCVQYPM